MFGWAERSNASNFYFLTRSFDLLKYFDEIEANIFFDTFPERVNRDLSFNFQVLAVFIANNRRISNRAQIQKQNGYQ